jgi:hypothetical protein
LLARSPGGEAAAEEGALYFLRQHGDLVRALDSRSRTYGFDASKEVEAKRQSRAQRQENAAAATTAELGARVLAADQSLPEQVLFVVRVVDAPAGIATEPAASQADLTEQDKRATRRDSANPESGSAETPPVPAPAPAGTGK